VRQDSAVPILMLTARGDPAATASRVWKLVADDYLPSRSRPRELLFRVNSLLAAPRRRKPRSWVRCGWRSTFHPGTSRLTRAGRPRKLTGAEAALLQLFCHPCWPALSAASELCKRLNVALERSIDVQVTRLRRKIEKTQSCRVICKRYGCG